MQHRQLRKGVGAGGLGHQACAADDVGAARNEACRCHPLGVQFLKTLRVDVNRVDGVHMGRHRAAPFTNVQEVKTAGMDMGVNKAGRGHQSFSIDNFRARSAQLGPHGRDLALFYQNVAPLRDRTILHSIEERPLDQEHIKPPPF